MPQQLPRFRQEEERREDECALERILLEAEQRDARYAAEIAAGSTAGGDSARLRGLPAIGRNVAGATVHTDPVRALEAKERRRRR